jgi:organic radical activating enzyme
MTTIKSKIGQLPIHETFQSTVQGEGFYAGAVVDFIRLAGCPVGCKFCDTGYSDGGAGLPRLMRSFDSLLAEIVSPIVVISGGEPMIHPALPDLCVALLNAGHRVHVETSGSNFIVLPDDVWVTLSPKDTVSPSHPALSSAWERANEIKIVISDGSEVEFYRHKMPKSKPCYLQPEWDNREKTIGLTMDLLRENPQMRLSLQTHKLIGVP